MLSTLMSNQSDVIEQIDSEMEKAVAEGSAPHDFRTNAQGWPHKFYQSAKQFP